MICLSLQMDMTRLLVVSGQWSVVSGQWSVDSGQWVVGSNVFAFGSANVARMVV